MKIQFNEVTWYSRLLALFTFFLVLIAGIAIGVALEKLSASSAVLDVAITKVSPESTLQEPSANMDSANQAQQGSEETLGVVIEGDIATYTDIRGYSFSFPSSWQLTRSDGGMFPENAYFQLYNFDATSEGCCTGKAGKNKIEGGYVTDFETWIKGTEGHAYKKDIVGGKEIYRLTESQEGESGDWTTAAIPSTDGSGYVTVNFYGDASMFDSLIETVFSQFTFTPKGQ